jgi:type II secretory pathway pseudopilin PulG
MKQPSTHLPTNGGRRARGEHGYAMAVLLVGIAIMGIMLAVAMPVWHQAMQREKEDELVFRGNQYARAVGLFQRKSGNAYPPTLDALVQQKYLRKKYRDPMVDDGVFQLIPAGAMQAGQVGASMSTTGGGRTAQMTSPAGSSLNSPRSSQFGQTGTAQTGFGTQTVVTAIAGVVSKSTDKSIRLYNGRDHYNEWLFIYTGAVGRGGVGVPGGRGGRGQGGPGGRGRGDQQDPGSIFGPGRGGRGRGGFGPGGGGTFDPTQSPPPQFPGGGRGPGRGGQ